ncbi:MAG: hypothetical protein HON51_00510 [Gammaproteobacteria bacterium]|jgi:hypothetical protein|nr:hypothetical protein [Gammaproteobacteria bacterium]MBT5221792.1 hypothetical protein [Gammaproteobacteria bacterium]MBT5967673.1 hypothetical protein [Gammaproteobacteria bacterium]MBT6420597.1 hypothetical protein [Gammaproteobacteria bacterium]MBT6574722.1 hypothetical protein [Gammaproteobacteria bacterium]
MPTNLPEIKQLLANWYLLAVDNAVFVSALVLSVWVLVAILYNFKMLFLKRDLRKAQQQHLKMQDKLSAAEQQVHQDEEKIAADAEQMLKDKQFIEEIQEKLLERNQRVVESIKAIAKKFDLNEQLVDSDKALQNEFVWQQQDNVIHQLIDRLSAAQQENSQASEKDSIISNLQSLLDMQIKQFVQLEQAIEVQKHEQQKEVQQQLNNTLEKHQLDFIQLIETVQNRSTLVDGTAQMTRSQEPIVQQQEPEQLENITEQQIVEFNAVQQISPVEQVTPTNIDGQQAAPEILDSVSALDGMLEQTVREESGITDSIEPLVEEHAEPVSKPDSLVQDLLNIAEPTFSTVAENEHQQGAKDSSVEKKSSLKVTGKIKGLLSKVKSPGSKSKTGNSAKAVAIDTVKTQETTDKPAKVTDKFKGLLGKTKKTSAKTEIKIGIEPAQKIEMFTAEDTTVSEAEQQIETFVTEGFNESGAEEIDVEPDYGSSIFKMPGALKKLLGKAKK